MDTDPPQLFSSELDEKNLNIIIAEHLFRSGNYQSGELFCKESKTDLSDEFKSKFLELNKIVSDIQT